MEKHLHYDEQEARYLATRNDESFAVFTAQQLNYARKQALMVKQPPLEAFSTFPVQTDVPPGAETASQKVYDSVGIAKIISDYSDDLPRVDLYAQETPVKVKSLGLAYGYNEQELRNAQFAGVNVSTLKAQQVKKGIDIAINNIAWNGDKKHNIVGFLQNENISEMALKGDGTDGTKFSGKTPEQILRDVKDLLQTIKKSTNGIENANCLYLAPEAYAHIATTPRSNVSDKTILDFMKQVFPNLIKIEERYALAGAGENGEDLMVAGVFDPTYLRLEIPERYKQLPVEQRNLEYIINCLARVIGVTVSYPMAFAKAVGV